MGVYNLFLEEGHVVPDMLEASRALFQLLGQRHPGLDAREQLATLANGTVGALGMGNSIARIHPVHRTGCDPLIRAERIAVMQPPLQEIGDGREADMRMGPDVDAALARKKLHRADLVEKDERTDHLAFRRRQGTAHLEPAKVAGPRGDDGFDRVDRVADRDLWVEGGVPAHGALLPLR